MQLGQGYKVKVASIEDILQELENKQDIQNFRKTLLEDEKINFKNEITFKNVNYYYEGLKKCFK